MSLENDIQELTAAVKALTAQMQSPIIGIANTSSSAGSSKPETTKATASKPAETHAPVGIEIVETVADPLFELKLPNGKIAKRFLELSQGGKGRDKQAGLLAQFGVKMPKELKVEQIPAFVDALEAAFIVPEPVVVEEKPAALEGELMGKDYDKPFEAGSPEFDAHLNRDTGILAVPYIKAGIEKQKILCAQFGIAKLSLLPRGRVDEMLKAIEVV